MLRDEEKLGLRHKVYEDWSTGVLEYWVMKVQRHKGKDSEE